MRTRILASLLGLTTVAVLAASATPATAAPATPAAPAGWSPANYGTSPDTALVAAIIRSNEKSAFTYFVGKGLTKSQSAGVIGNLDQESGMDPAIKQIGGGPGRGIAQWSVGGRWDTYAHDNNVAYAKGRKLSATSLSEQLAFVWYELTTYSNYGLSSVKAATSIDSAVLAFQNRFEGCSDCKTSARESFAHDAYSRYA